MVELSSMKAFKCRVKLQGEFALHHPDAISSHCNPSDSGAIPVSGNVQFSGALDFPALFNYEALAGFCQAVLDQKRDGASGGGTGNRIFRPTG